MCARVGRVPVSNTSRRLFSWESPRMTASVVLGALVWRHLDREERDAEAAES
jgi:hypothetical protein